MQAQDSKRNPVTLAVLYGAPVVTGVILIVVMNTTSPLESGPAGILAVFGFIYAFLATLCYLVIHLFGSIAKLFGLRKAMPHRQVYYVASILVMWPIFLLALNTLGRLEVTEIILVTLLVVIGCFYVTRLAAQQS